MRPKPPPTLLLGLLLALALALLATACIVGPYPPNGPRTAGPGWSGGPAPDAAVGVRFFYSDLSPYGDWITVERLGWVWVPWDMPAGWRPYTYGRWVYTTYGWTWVSDWSWGWAPFHYGRWTWQPRFGWVWVPGTVWAPAWVAWRTGPGWIGWAPLPPEVSWRAGIGLDLGAIDLNVSIGTTWWVFVDDRSFLEPRPWRHAYPAARNDWFVHRTRNVTRYEDVDGHAVDRGVPLGDLERSLGRAVPRYRVEEAPAPVGSRSDKLERDRVKVYRPDPERGGAATRTRPGESPRARPPADEDRALSPAAVDRAYQKDLRDLDRWQQDQRDRLDAIHRKEAKEAAEKASAEELRRRQEAEDRALAEQVARQRKALDTRHEQRKSDAASARKAAEAKASADKAKAKRRKPPGA